MNWLRSIAREILGLFVDDGSFAIAILVWLGVVVFVLKHVVVRTNWLSTVLFGGLAVILIESILRFARRRPPRR
jgi:hypothetical protein